MTHPSVIEDMATAGVKVSLYRVTWQIGRNGSMKDQDVFATSAEGALFECLANAMLLVDDDQVNHITVRRISL